MLKTKVSSINLLHAIVSLLSCWKLKYSLLGHLAETWNHHSFLGFTACYNIWLNQFWSNHIYILVGPVDMYRITIIDTKKLMSKKTSAFIHYYSRSINILLLVVVALFFRLTCKHKVTYSDFPNTMSLQFLTSNN